MGLTPLAWQVAAMVKAMARVFSRPRCGRTPPCPDTTHQLRQVHGCSHISLPPAAVYPAFDGPEGAAQALRWEPAEGRVEG